MAKFHFSIIPALSNKLMFPMNFLPKTKAISKTKQKPQHNFKPSKPPQYGLIIQITIQTSSAALSQHLAAKFWQIA